MRTILFRVVGAACILLGVGCLFIDLTTVYIVLATLLWIGGYTIWIMASPDSYNAMMDMQKMVDVPKKPLETLCQELQAVDTPLGKPWLCKIFSITEPVMVYGPDKTGSYIHCRWFNGGLFLVGSTQTDLLQPDADNAWRLEDIDENRNDQTGRRAESVSLAGGALEAYENFFKEYAHYNKVPNQETAAKIFGSAGALKGSLYVFAEDFKWTGQRFFMEDMDGNILYDIEGTYPLKTLRIREHGKDKVLFRVTKRILHVLPHYDFYAGDDDADKIGSFEKKLDFTRDRFVMQLKEGELSMRGVTATIGATYVVKLAGRQIGTISEDMSLTLENLLFDNLVIEVFDDQYTPLMAALGIMSAREMSRDRDDRPHWRNVG